MPNNPFYWLEVLKLAKSTKHLSNHYILKVGNKFMVLTSKPVPGVKSTLIDPCYNIIGKAAPQHIIEKIHIVDPATMIITKVEKGAAFYIKHKEIIDKFLLSLT